jgi:hypothetical protein
MNIKTFAAIATLSTLVGCSMTAGPDSQNNGNLGQFESAVRGTTGAVNRTAPAFNDINTCVKKEDRTDQTAGGGGNAYVGTTEGGTGFDVNYSFGGGHGCNNTTYVQPPLKNAGNR